MSKVEDKFPLEIKVDFDNITIPDNIDEYIQKGINKYQQTKVLHFRPRYLSAAVIITLLLLVSTIRLSPVFADYLDDIPILKYIVKLVNYDKGLKAAVENNFIQNINVSDEHEGIKFTVDNIIVDEARMLIFYTLENNSKYKNLNMNNVRLMDESRKGIKAGYSFGFFGHDPELSKIQETIKVSFGEATVIPDTVHLQVMFNFKDTAESTKAVQLPYLWEIDIPIDKSKFENMKEIYDINETIEIENQKINIQKAIVHPTRIELKLQFPEENTMKMLSFSSLKILDEKGEAFATITNDVSATMPDDNHTNLYFESNYFKNPKELYLQINSVRAVDKDKINMIVDLDKKQIINAPDNKLVLHDITYTDDETIIHFLLDTDEMLDKQFTYFIFDSRITDKEGKEYNCTVGSTSTSNPDFNQEILVQIPGNVRDASPLKLTIEDYPSRIKGDIKVRIK